MCRCGADPWAWLRDTDPHLAPPEWRLAWALHKPRPLTRDQWRDALGAVLDAHGPQAVVRGLRHAETIPQTGGEPWRPGELNALAYAIEHHDRSAAA